MFEKLFQGIKKNVLVLGIVSAINDASTEMVFSILPAFLISIGASAEIIGLIEGLADSSSSILKFIGGWLSDRFHKRKFFIVTGYSIASVTKLCLVIANTWPAVLFLRVLDRIGKGLRSAPRDAMISESTALSFQGKAFGFHRSMDTIGAVAGPLAAFVVLNYFSFTFKSIFILAFAFGAISVVFLFTNVKDSAAKKKIGKKISLNEFSMMPPKFKRFVLLTTVFSLGNFSIAFILLKASEIGISLDFIPLVYLLFNAAYVISAAPLGALSDKIGSKNVLILGYSLFAIACAGLAFSNSIAISLALIAILGIFSGVNDTIPSVITANLAPKQMKASALGLQQSISGIALLPAGIVFGLLWTVFSPTTAFLFSLGTSFVALILLLVFYER